MQVSQISTQTYSHNYNAFKPPHIQHIQTPSFYKALCENIHNLFPRSFALFWYSQGMSVSFVLFSLKLSQYSQFLEVEANFLIFRLYANLRDPIS